FTTLLFGLGLGALSESRTLGTVGSFLTNSGLGVFSGRTGLAILLGELGLIGIIFVGALWIFLIIKLWRLSRKVGSSNLAILSYGLLLFTIFGPLWLWYNPVISLPVPMLLYWTLLGYTLGAHSRRIEN
ncbi:hypothetical protein C5S36_03895, partial [Candidatus Methanophagaceae archaeon]